MIIDGRSLAQTVLARSLARTKTLPHAPRVTAIVANESPATASYLAIKTQRAAEAGCVLEVLRFPETVTTEELCDAIQACTSEAIIVQLPLPDSVDTKRVCDAIPVEKDADVLSSAARARFEAGKGTLLPPVVGAVKEILSTYAVPLQGKRVVVVGAGYLVGAPVRAWLTHEGAEVEVVTRESGDLHEALALAELIISGAGTPHLITPDMLRTGAVLIDAGTSESGGALAGDADPSCARVCGIFTPVPGGVGPLAVAKLFENAAMLATWEHPSG